MTEKPETKPLSRKTKFFYGIGDLGNAVVNSAIQFFLMKFYTDGALILPALVTVGEPRQLTLWNNDLLVAVPVFLFALRTRSLGGTVVLGMALYWLAGKFLG